MARTRMSFKTWLKAVIANRRGDLLDHYSGRPLADVEGLLHVSRARVYQLIEDGRLDVIEVVNSKGAVAITLVTDASIAKYVPQAAGSNQYVSIPAR